MGNCVRDVHSGLWFLWSETCYFNFLS
jgi:hypothetical protein